MLSVPTIAIMEVIIHSQMDSPQSTITTMHNFNIIIATNRTCVYLCVSCLIISDVRSQTNFESTKSFSHSRAKVERIKFRVYLVIWLKWKSNSEHSTTAASPPPPPLPHAVCINGFDSSKIPHDTWTFPFCHRNRKINTQHVHVDVRYECLYECVFWPASGRRGGTKWEVNRVNMHVTTYAVQCMLSTLCTEYWFAQNENKRKSKTCHM